MLCERITGAALTQNVHNTNIVILPVWLALKYNSRIDRLIHDLCSDPKPVDHHKQAN
jgi:hypothetical protein